MSSKETLNKELIQAIEQIDTTWTGRAKRLGITTRWMHEWRRGYVPDIVARLENEGVIHVAGRCTCSQPKAPDSPSPNE